jgi:hypothetical protein
MNTRTNRRALLLLGVAAVQLNLGLPVAGGEALAAEPQRLSVAHDRSGVTVEADGKLFATYVIDQANKPYLWPVVGPTGRPMTRAFPMQDLPEEPAAQRDHPHHRGITFGHESVGGAGWKFPESWDGRTGAEPFRGGGDTWHERLTFPVSDGQGEPTDRNRARLATLGRIVHREFTRVAADGDRAVIEEVCDHVDPAGRPLLVEQRRLTFRATGDTRTIDIDQEFSCAAASGAVRFDDRKDAGLFIRVPTTMAVDSNQGGRIMNSEGLVDKDAWSKPARWCHYHGPVAGEQMGIAILNHPASFRHPTRWHVRTYGLFAANPFASSQYDPALPDGTTTLAPGDVLRLHHRFFFHKIDEKSDGKGDAGTGVVEAAWKAYAAESPRPFAAASLPAMIVVGEGGSGWRDLTADDFENVNGEPGTWTWQGNSVRCTGQPVGVIRTKQPVTNLELSLEWRHLTSGGNSGVFLWAPPQALEKLPPGRLPPGGIEVQVLDHGYTAQYEKSSGKKADWFTTDGDVFPVGTSSMQPFPPVAPDGKRSFPTARHSRGTPEWNHYYIRAVDGEVRLWVNGHEVSGGSRCTPATGFLCLESEGAPVEFRRLRIRELPGGQTP